MRSVRGSAKGWANARRKANQRRNPKSTKDTMGCYVRRNFKLSDLGYASYQDYLASEEWKRIRKRKLQRHPKCLLCDRPSCQVHHLSYDERTLLGMLSVLLVALCEECHHGIEFDGNRKRTLEEANQELRRLAILRPDLERWRLTINRARKDFIFPWPR